MTIPLDSLLQSSADAIAQRDSDYMEAYSHYQTAVREASKALIKMNRTRLPHTREKAEKKYLAMMETWLKSRGALDDAQIARINTHATYAQIVRLLGEELVPKVQEIDARVRQLETENERSAEA